jgi:hypothetical protein
VSPGKKAVTRVVLIGALHGFLYLWLVPAVIYPRFGRNGFQLTVAVAVLVSVAVIGSLLVKRR